MSQESTKLSWGCPEGKCWVTPSIVTTQHEVVPKGFVTQHEMLPQDKPKLPQGTNQVCCETSKAPCPKS
jgi:hypothetical protein